MYRGRAAGQADHATDRGVKAPGGGVALFTGLLEAPWKMNYGGLGVRVLLPAESEEHEVLQTGSIHVPILPSCQFLYNSTFQVHRYLGIIWVVKIRNTSEAVLRPQYTHWPSY